MGPRALRSRRSPMHTGSDVWAGSRLTTKPASTSRLPKRYVAMASDVEIGRQRPPTILRHVPTKSIPSILVMRSAHDQGDRMRPAASAARDFGASVFNERFPSQLPARLICDRLASDQHPVCVTANSLHSGEPYERQTRNPPPSRQAAQAGAASAAAATTLELSWIRRRPSFAA